MKNNKHFLFLETATDVAGEVVDVGKAVKNFKPGDKVVALLNHLVINILLKGILFFLSFF